MARWTRDRQRKAWIKTGFSAYYGIFLVFIYGPMIAMFILSFQGERGGTSFPMRGFSLHWWKKLIEPSTVGDLQGAMGRSLILALIVMVLTALFSTMLAMAFRKKFRGSGLLFYTVLSGLMVPAREAPPRPGDPAIMIANRVLADSTLSWRPRRSSLDEILATAWQWHNREAT